MDSMEFQNEANCSKANEQVTGSKTFSMIQSILKFIENAVVLILGNTNNLLPNKKNVRTIDHVVGQIQCGNVAVEQAVSQILNYHRTVMEEHFSCSSQTNNGSDISIKLQCLIFKTMNRFETAVWENDLHELENIFHKEIGNINEESTSMNDCSNLTVHSEKMVEDSCSENRTDIQSDIATNDNNNNTNVPIVVTTNMQTSSVLMSEHIDEDIEQRFVEDLKNNANTIFCGDLNDRDTEAALQMVLKDKVFIDTVEQKEEENASNQSIRRDNTCNNCNKTKIFNTKISQVPVTSVKKPLQEKETDLFHVMVRHRCNEVGEYLTLEQKEMVRRSIFHCSDLISMQSISAVDALRHVEHLMKLLVDM